MLFRQHSLVSDRKKVVCFVMGQNSFPVSDITVPCRPGSPPGRLFQWMKNGSTFGAAVLSF